MAGKQAPGEAAEHDGDAMVWLPESSRAALEAYRVSKETKVLAILFADLEGSTRQQSELGNLAAADLVRRYRAVFRDTLNEQVEGTPRYDGQEVETAGDSFLVVFAAPSEAVMFALHVQANLRAARQKDPHLPHVRMGIHQGQVVAEYSSTEPKVLDIYGVQVSMAARIMGLGAGGQILLSRHVFEDAHAILKEDALAGLAEIRWINHGPYVLKGIRQRQDICEVGEAGFAPLSKPKGNEKAYPSDVFWRRMVRRTLGASVLVAAGVILCGLYVHWSLNRPPVLMPELHLSTTGGEVMPVYEWLQRRPLEQGAEITLNLEPQGADDINRYILMVNSSGRISFARVDADELGWSVDEGPVEALVLVLADSAVSERKADLLRQLLTERLAGKEPPKIPTEIASPGRSLCFARDAVERAPSSWYKELKDALDGFEGVRYHGLIFPVEPKQ